MFAARLRLFRVLLPLPFALCACSATVAMTPAELLDNLKPKQDAVASYRATIIESGQLAEQEFRNKFDIYWVKDGRFSISGILEMSGAAEPIVVETWFDGSAAFASGVCRGLKGYTKIDFSELPEKGGFPSRDSIGQIPGPASVGRVNLAALKDYELSVGEGEELRGQLTYALHARLKPGLKPKTISVQGREIPTQADRVSVWYGAGDGMVRKVELGLGDKLVYSVGVIELELNPKGTGSEFDSRFPPGAKVFDATEEFRSWIERSTSGEGR